MNTEDRKEDRVRTGEREDEAGESPTLRFDLIRRMMGYTKPYAKRRNILLLVTAARAIQVPMLAWMLSNIITGPIARGDLEGILRHAAGFTLLAVVTQATFYFRQRMALDLGEQVVHDLRGDIFRHLLRMPKSFYDTSSLGSIISRLTSDAEAVRLGIQNALFVSVVALGQMLVAAILMACCDLVMFAVVMAMGPAIYALNVHFRRRYSKATRDALRSFSRVTSSVAESVTGIRVTQGFVRQDTNVGIFRRLLDDHSDYNLAVARANGICLPLLELNSQFFVAALLIVGGYRVLTPDIGMDPGNLITFFFLAGIYFTQIPVMGNMYTVLFSSMAGAERVFRLLDSEPDWTDKPTARAISAIRGHVEFRNVNFEYVPDMPVLRDLSFVVEPGRTVAIVGHTGCGKSTTINLVAKFYLPTSGTVLIDGVDVQDIRSDSLHHFMGIILQENFLFDGTVMDNIRVGRPAATDEEVRNAVESLDCADLILSLPSGYDTEVGEAGGALSLGQRQIVCFARAMLADPQIFMLDEATSSVDSVTEARLQHALSKLLVNRTSFVIAHRLSTVRHADLVIVLDHGRIVEQGTHNELLARGEVYANLYRQFAASGEHHAGPS